MIAHAECIPCLVNQGLNAVRKLRLEPEKEKEIALAIVKYLSQFDRIDKSPAYYAYFVQELVKRYTGCEDPFYEIKRLSNSVAMEVVKSLGDVDLERAVFLSGAGNAMDFAIRDNIDINKLSEELLSMERGKFEIEKFTERIGKAESVLLIGDNAGEIVFDRLLAEVLNDMDREVFYAVKSGPILNDVLMEDALEVGMDKVCKVVQAGSSKVGTHLEECSEEFLKLFYSVDVVVSKGQANFETLSSVDRDVFFLLTVKCIPVQRETSSEKGKVCLIYKE